jgi:UDP-arabinose 4-epimerase
MSAPVCLVTGGAGFIGSHTCKQLQRDGFTPVAYDNLSTGHRESVRWGPLVEGDIADTALLAAALQSSGATAVIHFAASAYVGESVLDPARYYQNNVLGTLSVLEACRRAGVNVVVFSSSCATYGVHHQPISESDRQEPINPYGRTKLIGEGMLADFSSAYGLRFAALRYFNAAGADPEGELGEWHDPETHLIPRALLAADGRVPQLEVFGGDYPTPDGTCVRDYVHVTDLAHAHVLAMRHLLGGGQNLHLNLGAGIGSSIREVLRTVEQVVGRKVPHVMSPRRAGDPASLTADISKARTVLGFQPRHSDLTTIIRTAASVLLREAHNAA